jgi:hypothetical protein
MMKGLPLTILLKNSCDIKGVKEFLILSPTVIAHVLVV